MNKLQITLTDEEMNLLAMQAAHLGYDVTKYAKFVLAKQAEEALENVPVYKATPAMEKLAREAIAEHDAGKTHKWELADYDN
jgi:hypothetical protein